MDIDKKVTVESLAAWERFQNYCLNPTIEDERYFENWLNKYPEHEQTMEAAKAVVMTLFLNLPESEIQEEFNRFKREIDRKRGGNLTKIISISPKSKPKSNYKLWMGMAAGFMLLIATSIWYFNRTEEVNILNVATDFGEIVDYTLPDGSKVFLNANSKIHFKDNWETTDGARIIYLEGEAFFEVRPTDTQKAFLVRTSKGTVKVLGTSFNVSQRAENLEVALLEGKVEFKSPHHPKVLMQPGEAVILMEDQSLEKKQADVDATSAWRFKRLVFRGVSIRKVIKRLKHEFNLDVRVMNPSLLDRKVHATISKNNPELLLKALSELYELKINKLNENTYSIE